MTDKLPAPAVQSSTTEDYPFTAAVNLLHERLEWQGRTPTIAHPLSAGDKGSLNVRLTTLRQSLMPMSGDAERRQVGAALAAMFAGFPNAERLDPKATIAIYLTKLSGLPTWAVLAACADIEHGAVAGMSPDFPPSASRVYQLAEAKMADQRREKSQIEALLSAKAAGGPERTPEEVERVRLKAMQYQAERASQAADSAAMMAHRVAADAARDAERIKRGDIEILREYRAHNLEPVMSNGRPVSLRLAQMTGATLFKIGKAPPPRCEFTPQEDHQDGYSEEDRSHEPEQRADGVAG